MDFNWDLNHKGSSSGFGCTAGRVKPPQAWRWRPTRASPHPNVCCSMVDRGTLGFLNINAANICSHSNGSNLRLQTRWRIASNLIFEALAGFGLGSHELKA